MTKVERRIVDFLAEYFWIVVLAIGLVGGLILRRKGLKFESDDWLNYLQPWMQTLKENGGFKGLALDFATYYIPYLTLLAIGTYLPEASWLRYIKLTSIASEILFAAAGALIAYRLLKRDGRDPRWASAVFALLMVSPMVVLDGAFWGQCDYLYASLVMLSIYFVIGEQYSLAMNFFGIAYGFKQQAMFILPAILLLYLCNRRFPIWKFLYIPLWYLLGGLPAVIAGRPAQDVYAIYLSQADEFDQLSMNLPNIYRFFPNLEKSSFFKWGIAATLVLFAILALWVLQNRFTISWRAFLYLCAISGGICGMFIPALHERYLVLYAGFAYVYFMVYAKPKTVLAAVIDILVCMTYFLSLYGVNHLDEYHHMAAVHLCILCYMILDATRLIRAENAVRA